MTYDGITWLKNKLNIVENEAFLIEDALNIRALTQTSIDTGYLFICEKNVSFITDSRYIEVAKNYFENSNVNVVLQDKLSENIKALCIDNNITKMHIEADYQTVSKLAFFEKCCFEIVHDGKLDSALKLLRSVKKPFEVSALKKAQKITDMAFEQALKFIKVGVCERELALFIEFFMRNNGANAVSFDLIAIAGKNTSLPHGVPGNYSIKSGDFVTMDIGCKVDGYCSDMTRTVAVGSVTDEMKNVYDTVLKAQQSAISTVKANVKCADVDLAARNIIYNAGFKGCFGHGTGHGVGLFIHEAPTVSFRSNDVLQAGNIITVEPGIYLENKFGVRIEDMGMVTEDGFDDFTESPKNLIIL